MWIKFTAEYLAGFMAGVGLGLFFILLAVQSDLLTLSNLKSDVFGLAGIALLMGGGAWKMRLQAKK